MTAADDDMDTLIQRLRDQAAQIEAEDSLAIESWFSLWQQRLAPICQNQPARLYEPRRPRLAELVSAHKSDPAFIERAYLLLTGRASDPEGAAYYQQLATRDGRLCALVVLLRSDEVQTYIQHQQIQLPLSLRRLSRSYHYLSVIPVIGLRCWRIIALALWQRYQRRWQEDAEYYEMLAHQGLRHREYQALATTLMEMAEIQALIVDQLDRSSGSTITVQQAQTMTDMLKTAQQALSNTEAEEP